MNEGFMMDFRENCKNSRKRKIPFLAEFYLISDR